MRRGSCLAAVIAVAGCQTPSLAPTAAPRACDVAAFGATAGIELPATERETRRIAEPPSKSQPLRYAQAIPVRRRARDVGTWSEAAPGWRSWRVWLRSEQARSLAVYLEPMSLPARAELWFCSPDGTVRQGPFDGRGPSQTGRLWSPQVPGPELWLEVLVPDGREGAVEVTIASAFAAFR